MPNTGHDVTRLAIGLTLNLLII